MGVVNRSSQTVTRSNPRAGEGRGAIQGAILRETEPNSRDLNRSGKRKPNTADPPRSHNPKVAGSNPAPATREGPANGAFSKNHPFPGKILATKPDRTDPAAATISEASD